MVTIGGRPRLFQTTLVCLMNLSGTPFPQGRAAWEWMKSMTPVSSMLQNSLVEPLQSITFWRYWTMALSVLARLRPNSPRMDLLGRFVLRAVWRCCASSGAVRTISMSLSAHSLSSFFLSSSSSAPAPPQHHVRALLLRRCPF